MWHRLILARSARLLCAGAALAAALVLPACNLGRHETPRRQVPGGDAERGEAAIRAYGCGGCHVVPGVRGANGRAGPPLDHYARRAYVAGVISNRPENLVRWIMEPQAIDPQTAMPDLGVSERDARDMADYLYTLR